MQFGTKNHPIVDLDFSSKSLKTLFWYSLLILETSNDVEFIKYIPAISPFNV